MRHLLPLHFTVPPSLSGTRLDAVLDHALPGLGVRARRRLWEWCAVCVNGKKRKAGYTVKAGDAIAIEERCGLKDMAADAVMPEGDVSQPRLLGVQGEFALFFKPKGLHSAAISGGPEASLEALVPGIWQRFCQDENRKGNGLILLTRLDLPTSGIVVAALSKEAEHRFRGWERAGNVCKTYFAVAQGAVTAPFTVKNVLATDNRAKTVVRQNDGEPTRWSKATPLALLSQIDLCRPPFPLWRDDLWKTVPLLVAQEGMAATLLRVEILRGARHQIRSHMAYAGFPLVGDTLYGEGEGEFFLHHGSIITPEFSCELPPDWLKNRY